MRTNVGGGRQYGSMRFSVPADGGEIDWFIMGGVPRWYVRVYRWLRYYARPKAHVEWDDVAKE